MDQLKRKKGTQLADSGLYSAKHLQSSTCLCNQLQRLIKIAHDTLLHCTHFSSVLKTEPRDSLIRYCCPGDTTLSTPGDPTTEPNKPKLAGISSTKNIL